MHANILVQQEYLKQNQEKGRKNSEKIYDSG